MACTASTPIATVSTAQLSRSLSATYLPAMQVGNTCQPHRHVAGGGERRLGGTALCIQVSGMGGRVLMWLAGLCGLQNGSCCECLAKSVLCKHHTSAPSKTRAAQLRAGCGGQGAPQLPRLIPKGCAAWGPGQGGQEHQS